MRVQCTWKEPILTYILKGSRKNTSAMSCTRRRTVGRSAGSGTLFCRHNHLFLPICRRNNIVQAKFFLPFPIIEWDCISFLCPSLAVGHSRLGCLFFSAPRLEPVDKLIFPEPKCFQLLPSSNLRDTSVSHYPTTEQSSHQVAWRQIPGRIGWG